MCDTFPLSKILFPEKNRKTAAPTWKQFTAQQMLASPLKRCHMTDSSNPKLDNVHVKIYNCHEINKYCKFNGYPKC